MEVDDLELETYYDFAFDLVKKAGRIARDNFEKPKTIETKTCNLDLVTETDHEIEKLIVTSLLQQFPNHKIIGEESVAGGQKCILSDEPTWIIDPVDGTMNFVHCFPMFCVSLALWIHQTPYIGIVYNPTLEQMFTARRGKSAFLNGTHISSSKVKDIDKSLISLGFGLSQCPKNVEAALKNFKTLVSHTHGIRISGSAVFNLAMVATGAIDCTFHFGTHIWDIAAAILLVQEAGGFVCDPSGGKVDPFSRRILCAGTQELARKVISLLTQYYPERDS